MNQQIEASDYKTEDKAFQELLPKLLTARRGQFVAIQNGTIIDGDMDEIALARRLEQTHRHEFVLVRQVMPKTAGKDYLESPEEESR